MADSFQTIVDRGVTPDEAEQLALAVVGWLVENGIVAGAQTDCTLDKSPGYPPGDRYSSAVVEADPNLESLLSNGLEVSVGRFVGTPVDDPWSLFCPNCNNQAKFGPAWDRAMNDWWSGHGPGLLQCSACRQAQPVIDWRYEPSWGFGHLSFTFWNWPPLTDKFLTDLIARLGHEVVFLFGRL